MIFSRREVMMTGTAMTHTNMNNFIPKPHKATGPAAPSYGHIMLTSFNEAAIYGTLVNVSCEPN